MGQETAAEGSPRDGAESGPPDLGLGADPGAAQAASRLLPAPGGSPTLDRLAELAARLVGASSAQVSLLTHEQVVAGGAGLAPGAVDSSGPLGESLCTITAASGATFVVPDAAADPRLAALPPVSSGAVGAYLGVPLVTSTGVIVGALCAFDGAARSWSASDVGILEVLAESVMSELELAALSAEYEFGRLRWDVASDAAEIGSFEVDLRTGRIALDERMREIYGYPPATSVVQREEVLLRLHPEDRPGVDAAFAAAVESGRDYRVEYRLLHPDGEVRWITVRGRVQGDPAGAPAKLIGAAYDNTDVRSAHDRAADLLANMKTGFLAVDPDWRITYLNRAGELVVAMAADEIVGQVLWDAFPGIEDLDSGRQYRRAVSSGETVELEAYYPHLHAWFEVRAVPSNGGLVLYFIDITSRHLAQAENEKARLRAEALQAQAEAAAARLALLAAVSAELTATLDAETAVARLARLVIPTLADWCIVTLVDDDGTLRDVGWWHADPALRPVVERLASTRFDNRDWQGPVQQVRDSGAAVITRSHVTDRAAELLGSETALAAMRQLAPESSAALPLIIRGQVIGVLSLCRGAARAPMSDEALLTGRQIAERAAVALDNARLFTQQRTLAESLQRSLLTAPSEPDHLHVAVRYVPAATGVSVGGDWHDAFVQPDGATVLGIGDVVGHDTNAAVAMAQLRGLFRGIAWSSGASPALILGSLDSAITGLGLATMATAIAARLEQTEAQRERGIRTLRWSNAGHPPPLLLNPDGTVLRLETGQPELLLGVNPDAARTDTVTTLAPGTTVLFYTDGLIERHDQHLDEGLARLVRTIAEIAELPLEQMCDEMLARMLPHHPDDDVAILAVRLHPEDEPRPPEAGPENIPGD